MKLCFQQSTGDSALPEIDVALAGGAHRFLDQDVADLQPTTGLEHARHLGKSRDFVREEIQYAVRDDDVGPTVLHRQRLGECMSKLDVLGRHLDSAGACTLDH